MRQGFLTPVGMSECRNVGRSGIGLSDDRTVELSDCPSAKGRSI
ncbi:MULTISPECIES: hypothetical protein [unclassified Microcoleus]